MPLVVLYPLSTGIGIISTLYVAGEINHSYPASEALPVTTTQNQPANSTTPSPSISNSQKQLEMEKINALKSQIALLKVQLQALLAESSSAPAPCSIQRGV